MLIFQGLYKNELFNWSLSDIFIFLVLLFAIYLYAKMRQAKKQDIRAYKFFKTALVTKVVVSFLYALSVKILYLGDSMV